METNRITINGVDHSVEDLTEQEKHLLARTQECQRRVAEAEFAHGREVAALECISKLLVESIQKRTEEDAEAQPENISSSKPIMGSPAMTVN